MRWRAAAMSLVCVGLLSACATGRAPQRLAETTAANVGVVGSHLQRLARDSRELADQRAANIAALHAANARGRAAYNYDLALTKRSGGAPNLQLIQQVEAWGKEVDAIFAAADNAEKERKDAVLATQTALDTKSASLVQIAEALATLARDESATERARFLTGYVGQLRKEIDTQLQQSNASATAANNLLKNFKSRVTTDAD
jgi:hypothetical protein